MTINIERATKLIDTLASETFKQHHGALRRGDAYCCLGVACEIFRRETGEGEWEEITNKFGNTMSVFVVGDQRDCLVPPPKVVEWFGFKRPNPAFPGKLSMAEMNDLERMSFKDISEALRESIITNNEVDIPPPGFLKE